MENKEKEIQELKDEIEKLKQENQKKKQNNNYWVPWWLKNEDIDKLIDRRKKIIKFLLFIWLPITIIAPIVVGVLLAVLL